LGTSTI